MIRRPRRSVPATVVAVVLLATCVLTVVAVVQSLLGRPPLISLDQLLAVSSAQTWSGPAVLTTAVVVAVIGLILLVAAISPGAPTVLPLADLGSEGEPSAGVRRATLEKDLGSAAEGVSGVTSARVTAGRSAVTVQVGVAASDAAAVPDQVRERVEARLADIGPTHRPRVRVRARRDES